MIFSHIIQLEGLSLDLRIVLAAYGTVAFLVVVAMAAFFFFFFLSNTCTGSVAAIN